MIDRWRKWEVIGLKNAGFLCSLRLVSPNNRSSWDDCLLTFPWFTFYKSFNHKSIGQNFYHKVLFLFPLRLERVKRGGNDKRNEWKWRGIRRVSEENGKWISGFHLSHLVPISFHVSHPVPSFFRSLRPQGSAYGTNGKEGGTDKPSQRKCNERGRG